MRWDPDLLHFKATNSDSLCQPSSLVSSIFCFFSTEMMSLFRNWSCILGPGIAEKWLKNLYRTNEISEPMKMNCTTKSWKVPGEIAVGKQVSNVVLVTLTPLFLKPLRSIQCWLLWMRFDPSIDVWPGSISQSRLQRVELEPVQEVCEMSTDMFDSWFSKTEISEFRFFYPKKKRSSKNRSMIKPCAWFPNFPVVVLVLEAWGCR